MPILKLMFLLFLLLVAIGLIQHKYLKEVKWNGITSGLVFLRLVACNDQQKISKFGQYSITRY